MNSGEVLSCHAIVIFGLFYSIYLRFLKKLPHIIKAKLFEDSKSRFQEEAQERVGITPIYKVLEEFGPDHAKDFIIGAFLSEDLIAKGRGSSKQEAEEEAAKNALEIKNW